MKTNQPKPAPSIPFGAFLTRYRNSISAITGKPFSMRMLAEMLEVDQWRLQKWEKKGFLPTDDEDRNKIKSFFKIANLENITESSIAHGIDCYKKKNNLKSVPNFVTSSESENFDNIEEKLLTAIEANTKAVEALYKILSKWKP
jgi:hypothetical protein